MLVRFDPPLEFELEEPEPEVDLELLAPVEELVELDFVPELVEDLLLLELLELDLLPELELDLLPELDLLDPPVVLIEILETSLVLSKSASEFSESFKRDLSHLSH